VYVLTKYIFSESPNVPKSSLKPIWRRERSVHTPDVEERVLDCAEENPDVSTRQIATELNVVHMTV
jgi:hypothetical protein